MGVVGLGLHIGRVLGVFTWVINVFQRLEFRIAGHGRFTSSKAEVSYGLTRHYISLFPDSIIAYINKPGKNRQGTEIPFV